MQYMTNKGFIMSIDRFGINKSDRGPLAKCSFEETPDIVLAKAALFGELDHINGVSSNTMMGQEVPIGTGAIDLFFDENSFNQTNVPDAYESIKLKKILITNILIIIVHKKI